MVEPAILYKDEIIKQMQSYWYTEDMLYETGCLENWAPNITANPEQGVYQWAIVDNNKKLIGFLGYRVDFYSSRVYNFGLFSFDRGNVLVGKSVFNKLEELVSTYHRVEWRAVASNPACRAYDRYIQRHNGKKHILKDAIRDAKGNYVDDIIYEIINKCNYNLEELEFLGLE